MNNQLTLEEIKDMFKNHKAHLKILDEDTQILTWKEHGTRCCQIDFVFFKNNLFITGDLRSAVFNTTWKTTWDCQNGWNLELGYFAEKLDAITENKYEWDSDIAIKKITDYYREYFNYLQNREFDKILSEIIKHDVHDEFDFEIFIDHCEFKYDEEDRKYLLQMSIALHYAKYSTSQEEYAFGINDNDDFCDFNDFWEWGYNCGCVLNPDIQVYLIALQMAYQQLIKKEEKENVLYKNTIRRLKNIGIKEDEQEKIIIELSMEIECYRKRIEILINNAKRIRNEEKYRKKIAQMITRDDGGYSCGLFSENSECDACALDGICLHDDKVENWLKSYCKEEG